MINKEAAEQPECKTCGGSGIKPFTKFYYCIRCNEDVSEDHLVTLYRDKPTDRCPICKNKVVEKSTCSACKEQPPDSDFTKRFRVLLAKQDKTVIVQDAYEACDYLDASQASRKELVEALEKYGECESGCIKGDAYNCGLKKAIKKGKE